MNKTYVKGLTQFLAHWEYQYMLITSLSITIMELNLEDIELLETKFRYCSQKITTDVWKLPERKEILSINIIIYTK